MILVIGGGPAGSAAAWAAATAGADVLLIESQGPNRDKPCSGGLLPRAERSLGSMGFDPDPCTLGWVRQTQVRAPSGARALIRHRPLRFVDRAEFDRLLRDHAAQAGAQVRYHCRATALREEQGRVIVSVLDGGQAGELAADMVIGADGATGIAQHYVAGGPHRLRAAALEARCALDTPGPSVLDWSVPGGYRWLFRKPESGTVGIGLGGIVMDARTRMAAWACECGFPINAAHGHIVPLSLQRRLVRGRVLLAGDAAGATDPLLGEGISGALMTGLLAGRWAAAAALGRRELAGYEAAARWAVTKATGLSRLLFGLRLRQWDPWFDRAFGLLGRFGGARALGLVLR